MKCLIVAAGQGKRLQEKGLSKPLVPLLGRPLIGHVFHAAREGGADDFYVVVGHEADQVKRYVSGLADGSKVPVTFIPNPDYANSDNGTSTLLAQPYLQEPFLLLMADNLFEPEIARAMEAEGVAAGEISLAVDENLNNPWVDVHDVAVVWQEDGKIIEFGYELPRFNGYDSAVMYCSPGIFPVLEHTISQGDSSLNGAFYYLVPQGKVKAVLVGGLFWLDVDDPLAYAKAEQALRERPHLFPAPEAG